MQLDSDEEHVEHDADLRNHAERRRNRRRENDGRQLGTEQRGAQQNAGDHLADDGRLMNLREEAGQDLTGDDHRAERDQYAKEN